MSIGNILIRPQLLARQNNDADAQTMDLFFGLMMQLSQDFAAGGNSSKKIIAAIGDEQHELNTLIQSLVPKLEGANATMMSWMNPYLSIIDGIKNEDFSDPSQMGQVIDKIFELAAKIISDLKSDKIAALLNNLADIVENDLELKYATFEQLFLSFFNRIVDALEADFLGGVQTDEAINQFALARQALRLEKLLTDLLKANPLPAFNVRLLVAEFQRQLEMDGWDTSLDAIQGQLEKAKQIISDLIPVIKMVLDLQGTRDISPGKRYSWYASWFLDEGTTVADPFNLENEPFAQDMGLGSGQTLPIGTGFLEVWTQFSKIVSSIAKAIIYGLQIDKDRKVSPALTMGWQITMAILSMFSSAGESETLADFYKFINDDTFQKIITKVLAIGGSFEEYPGGFWEWLLDIAPAASSRQSDGTEIPDLVCDLFLSLFTLINSEAKNKDRIKGFTALGRYGGTRIASLALGRKDLYYQVFSDNFGLTVLAILSGGAITYAFEFIGWLLSGAVSRGFSDRYWKFESEGFSLVTEFLGDKNAFGGILLNSHKEFFTTWGDFWAGKTDKGAFGVKVSKDQDGKITRQEIKFKGYPEQSSSPYKLPFPKSKPVLCLQSHQGFSSHNYRKGQIYAVDFLLLPGQDILAMRDGVVENAIDTFEKKEEDHNYILIRHDPDPAHDLGENGNLLPCSYARYEVAKNESINCMVNTKVKQGDIIMKLGSRHGFLSTDYLQVTVSADKDGIIPSIPFVFNDIEGNGVPETGKYYVSGNGK